MYSESVERALKARSIGVGDRIRLTAEKGVFEGVLMPRPESGDSNVIVLKLDSGYNVGMLFTSGTKLDKVGATKESFAFPKAEMPKKKPDRKITILSTGGTIGSKVDYITGGVYMITDPAELLFNVPELADIAEIEIKDLMRWASEDLSYMEWQRIAEGVVQAFKGGSRGVVITLGTDMMHYTAAALSFMLKDINGPVVLTGAQRSSDRGSSDAFMNLICSAHIAAKSNIAEVGVCMHAGSSDKTCNFIRGTKVRKMHTSRRDAFKPINSAPIATVDDSGKIEYKSDYRKIGGAAGMPEAVTEFEPKVAMLKVYPNSDPSVIDYYIAKEYRGLIIEGTGLGHAPVSTPHKEYNWLEWIRRACNSGMVVGMTSQCLNGRVNTNVYRNLRLIRDAGVIFCEDMLPETAYVKLGYLLANFERDEAKDLLAKNIAGEINERTEFEWFRD